MSSVMPSDDAFARALGKDNDHGIINIEGTSLDDDARMDALLARIAEVKNLHYLNVNHCTDDPKRLNRVLDAVPTDGMDTLCMINCATDRGTVDAFAKFAGVLTRLLIDYCTQDADMTGAFIEPLATDGSLRALSVLGCPHDDRVLDAVIARASGLDHLKISDIDDKDRLVRLLKTLPHDGSMKKIRLDNCPVDAIALPILVKCLSGAEEVALRDSVEYAKHTHEIFGGLSKDGSLGVFQIDGCPIYLRTLQSYGDCLKSVKFLTVNDCFEEQPPETVTTFLNCLADDQNLRALYMRGACLNDDGAEALAARAGGLERLCIDDCCKKEAHTTLILCASPKDGKLVSINMANCPVNADGAEELTEMVPWLEKLDITGTGITEGTYPPLTTALWEMKRRGGAVECDFDLDIAQLWRKGAELNRSDDPAKQALFRSVSAKIDELQQRHAFSADDAERILKTLEWAETMQKKFCDAGQLDRLEQLSRMSVDQYDALMELAKIADSLGQKIQAAINNADVERAGNFFRTAIDSIEDPDNTVGREDGAMAHEFFCTLNGALLSCINLSFAATSEMYKIGKQLKREKILHWGFELAANSGGGALGTYLGTEGSYLEETYGKTNGPTRAAAIGGIVTTLILALQEYSDSKFETERARQIFDGFVKVRRLINTADPEDRLRSFAPVSRTAKDFCAAISACIMIHVLFPREAYGDRGEERHRPANKNTAISMMHSYVAKITHVIAFENFTVTSLEDAVPWVIGKTLANESDAYTLWHKIKDACAPPKDMPALDLKGFPNNQDVAHLNERIVELEQENSDLCKRLTLLEKEKSDFPTRLTALEQLVHAVVAGSSVSVEHLLATVGTDIDASEHRRHTALGRDAERKAKQQLAESAARRLPTLTKRKPYSFT